MSTHLQIADIIRIESKKYKEAKDEPELREGCLAIAAALYKAISKGEIEGVGVCEGCNCLDYYKRGGKKKEGKEQGS